MTQVNSLRNEQSALSCKPGGYESEIRRLRVCRVVTVPVTFSVVLGRQIRHIISAGIDLTLVSSPGPELDELRTALPVRCFAIPMARKATPMLDLSALLRLTRFLRRERFDIVHSSTPKAGILTALAGRMAKVPIRIHTYTGQVWVEMHGLMRWIARESDRLIGWLTTHCYADSDSQATFLIGEQIVDAQKITVLAPGSLAGVDLERFNPATTGLEGLEVRKRLGIPQSSTVVGFVGRLTRDKGIAELVSAFRMLQQDNKNLRSDLSWSIRVDPGQSAHGDNAGNIYESAHPFGGTCVPPGRVLGCGGCLLLTQLPGGVSHGYSPGWGYESALYRDACDRSSGLRSGRRDRLASAPKGRDRACSNIEETASVS